MAYEALRTVDGRNFPGHVHDLFTVGSALANDLVQPLVRPSDGLRPRSVRRWVNLDAVGDVVGGQLSGEFAVDLDRVDLPPFGCADFLGWVSPSCAHGSYFTTGNTAVNRDIFAAEIEQP